MCVSHLSTSDDNFFLVSTSLTKHAEFEAAQGRVMMSTARLIPTIRTIIILSIFSILERHDYVRRIDNGIVLEILIQIIKPTLSEGPYSAWFNLLLGDEPEQIKEMTTFLNKCVASLFGIAIPSSNLVQERKAILTNGNLHVLQIGQGRGAGSTSKKKADATARSTSSRYTSWTYHLDVPNSRQ